MKDIKQIVATDIINLMINKSLTPQEEAVLAVLTDRWSDREVTQKEIALSNRWRKATPLAQANTTVNTTTRKIRKVIRSLRVTHKLPILHNANGHYLPSSQEELEDFMTRLEIEAKGRAASTMETYKVMKNALGITSDVFESLDIVGMQLIRQSAM